MAWAEQQRSGRWTGKYRNAAQKTRSAGTFTRRAEAERAAAVAEDKARRDPTALDPRDGRMPWSSWCHQEWLPARRVEATTKAGDTSNINNHLLPRWGDVPLNAIRRADVQRWVNDLSDSGLGAWSVIHCYNLLSNSLKVAVTDKRIAVSPCVQIALPATPQGDERFLTHAEVSAIAAVLNEPHRTMMLLLVGTGLRWGEAAALHWARVDLDSAHVDVVEAWDGAKREIKPYPKNRKLRRVWMAPWLPEELERHRAAFPPGPRCATAHRSGSRCRSGLVVAGVGGTVLDYHNFRITQWGRAVGRTEWELPDGRRFAKRTAARNAAKGRTQPHTVWVPGLARVGGGPVEHATIHDLRHTYASWAVQQGVPLYDLSEQLGHSSLTVTQRYAHLAESSKERFRSALAWPGAQEFALQPRSSGLGDLPA